MGWNYTALPCISFSLVFSYLVIYHIIDMSEEYICMFRLDSIELYYSVLSSKSFLFRFLGTEFRFGWQSRQCIGACTE